MKRIFLFTILCVQALFSYSANLNEEQRALRRELLTILGKEGFNPEFDSDSDIKFVYDNLKYYVTVEDHWQDPFLVIFYVPFSYSDEYSKNVMTNCISLVAQSKAVKLYCYDKSYQLKCQLFCKNANAFKIGFKAMLEQLKNAQADVRRIVQSGIGDLNLATDKAGIFERGEKFYRNEEYEKSFAIFNLLANEGYSSAYRYLGESYEQGFGVQRNKEKMVSCYEKAVATGDYWCANKLARYFYEQENYAKAYDMFLKCASNVNENRSDAFYMIGTMYEEGLGRDVSRVDAIQHYKKSVQYSTTLDCKARLALRRLGVQVENKDDFVDATKTMLMGLRSPKEMYDLGNEYENGLNKRLVSLPKAYAYYKAAADRDYTKAFVKMGEIFASEYYPFKDKERSDKYYQKAFKVYNKKTDSDGEACYEIGNMYKNGFGVGKDDEQAKKYFKQGAMKNNKNASYEYGLICKADIDYPEAFKYFLQAAENGHGLAMYELAICYENGTGTDTNRSKAIEWYKKCVGDNNSKSGDAKTALKRLGLNDEEM